MRVSLPQFLRRRSATPEKLPQEEESTHKLDVHRGGGIRAIGGGGPSQSRSKGEPESPLDERGEVAGPTDAPLKRKGASEPGRENQDRTNQNQEREDKKAERNPAGAAKTGKEEARRGAAKHALQKGATASSAEEGMPGSRGEGDETPVETGNRLALNDAAGQQGAAERVGNFKDLSLLDEPVSLRDQSADRPTGLWQNPQNDLLEGRRRPYGCNLCGAHFAYPQALGGHMRLHRNVIAAAQSPSDLFSVFRPPSSQCHSFASGARSSGGPCRQADPRAAVLQALDSRLLSLGNGVGDLTSSRGNSGMLGLDKAVKSCTTSDKPKRECLAGLVNQRELKTTASSPQHDNLLIGPLSSPTQIPEASAEPPSCLIYLPSQGAFPGGWFELEHVDVRHPERIAPVNLGGNHKLVAEQVLEALVRQAERPTSAAVHPAIPK
ncbi:hypothetical protein KFL_010020030 [Klebsormidium nitens]|uniref:C2H2-type domain-containing protein n=1 Tax=Klebsormidium nitens TaxID=105231 RepID=A0A1Y1IS95_KLENI|nr:hypothetical protein KFL_010020030 [Klebsormidium nitens]|eukprot:GAQ92389.1 hypothetical protein KFL_010020030 [Klebsormidium nitens]